MYYGICETARMTDLWGREMVLAQEEINESHGDDGADNYGQGDPAAIAASPGLQLRRIGIRQSPSNLRVSQFLTGYASILWF